MSRWRWKRQLTTFLLAVCMVISLLPSGHAVSVPGAAGETAEPVDEVETLAAPVVMDAEAEDAAEALAPPVAKETADVSESVTEEAAEATAESVAEEAAEAAAEPAAEDAAETAAEPVAEDAAETAAEPVAEEAAEAAAESVAEDAAETAAEPVAKDAAETAAEPAAAEPAAAEPAAAEPAAAEPAAEEPVQQPEKPKGKEPEPEAEEAAVSKKPLVEPTEDMDSKALEKSGDFPDEEEGKASLLAGDVQAQVQEATSGRLIYQDTSTVEAGSRVRYSYTPSVTSIYTFESVNSSGDAVGWITTAADENTVLAQNDDGSTNYNFRVTLPLTAGTTYYLYARWYGSSSSGAMSIELYRQEEIVPLTADGSTVTVDIDTAGTMRYFSFTPESIGSYTFESVNEEGDTYGYLYDSSWNSLASNDDGGAGLNFLITYTLEGGHTYYYAVRWYSSSRTGTINVRLKGGSVTDKVLRQPTGSDPVTDYEEITEAGQRKYFSFTPTADASYTFESTNTANDPVGELYAADKTTMLTSNDDGGDGANFCIVYDLTAGTTYYYAVRFYGGSTTARIDVRLSLTDPDGPTPIIPVVLSPQDVDLRGFTTDSVNPADSSNRAVRDGKGWFSFTPTVSGTYLFESTNNSGDPTGELYTSLSGSAVTTNDDGGNANGNGMNFRLSYNLTQGTTYYCAVRWIGSSSGTVEVRIRRSLDELSTSLTAGATATANIDQRGRVVYYSFTPSNTQEYTFESTSYTSGDANNFDPYVTLYDSDFNVIVNNDDGGSGLNFRITRTLTANTPYYFAAKRLNDSSVGTMEVRLSGNNSDTVTVINPSDVVGSGWSGTASINAAGSISYFSFTPQTTDDYVFLSTLSSGDPAGELYVGEPGSAVQVYSDDDGDGLNFSITRSLTAGTTYYYGVRWYASGRTGDISVRMSKVSVNVIPLDAAAVERSGSATASGEATNDNQVVYFSFRPSSTDTYLFESTNSSLDPYGYFYGTSNPGGDAIAANDDGGSGLNFRLSQRLTAGTTYYFGARFLFGHTGTLNVRMSKGTSTTVEPTAVSVSLGRSTILVGNQTTATAQITPSNATNRSITWSSSDPSKATVSSSGVVTGVAAGTATITARTSNNKTGSATITVTAPPIPDPDPTTRQFNPDFTYGFTNSFSGFGYPSGYRMPVERYMQLGYNRQQAEALYRSHVWGGNCFGMSVSVILFYKDILREENYDANARVPHDFSAPASNYRKLRDMIELFQESQSMPIARYNQPSFDASAVASQLDQGNPVKFGIGGHAVVIYSYTRNGSTYTFNIYDNAQFVDTLTYTSSSNYQFTRNGQPAQGSWRPANYCTADNIRTVYNAIKNQNSNGAANLLSVDGQDYIYIICPVGDLTLVNAHNQTATIRNNVLEYPDGMDIELVLPSIPQGATGYGENDTYRIVVPEDTWRINGPDNLIIVGTDMSVDVNVTSNSHRDITISPDQHTIGVATENDDEYDVMYSLYNEYFDTLRVHGIAGEPVNISLKTDDAADGHVEVTGARTIISDVTVSDKTTTVEDTLDFEQTPTDFAIYWPVSGAGTENESASLTIRYPSEEMENAGEDVEKSTDDDADGKDNQLASRSQTQKPSFDEPRLNSLTGSMELEIIKPDNDSIVYYYATTVLDAEMPNPVTGGQMYTGPILVTPNTRIVAVATRSGYADSEVATWDYNQLVSELLGYYGDVNGDGTVTVGEITQIIVARSRGSISDVLRQAADINNDGTVTVGEITQIIVARSRGNKIERRN